MRRPFLVWLGFTACVVVGLGVLAWFSREMLRLERESDEARQLAQTEEKVRLALWRMDATVAKIHGIEAARPAGDYTSFAVAGSAFSRSHAPLQPGSVLLPSPLLGYAPPLVHLHFQIEPDGSVASPQTPAGALRAAAIAGGIPEDALDNAADLLETMRDDVDYRALSAGLPAPEVEAITLAGFAREPEDADESEFSAKEAPAQAAMQEAASPAVAAEKFQYAKNFAERQKREDLVVAQTIENTYLANRSSFNNPLPTESPAEEERAQSAPTSSGRAQQSSSSFKKSADTAAAPPPLAVAASRPTRFESDDRVAALAMAEPAYAPAVAVAVGAIQAVWSDGELFFARRARVDGTEFIQGAWLDWDELEALLLSRVADLLPDATLEPITTGRATNGAEAARRLAFLPVILETGAVATGNGDGWTPLRVSLATAWGSAAIGAAALALLLAGTLRLSERRGAFVSAVTHELRTPLTTFRMYTEMLAGGMVPDESRRRGYLDTLRKEAERLSHLVENVLSYARLERGRASSRVEDTTPLGLLERVEERLRQRAEQGALELRVEFAGDSGSRALRTDTTAVEQILFNLVDNAAKYARPAEGTAELRLSVAPRANGGVHVRVRDNGPGLPPAARKRLFRPFSKSATEAAHSQPGVGLGLALSRRLARDELHGDLALEETGPGGTTFRLDLPAG